MGLRAGWEALGLMGAKLPWLLQLREIRLLRLLPAQRLPARAATWPQSQSTRVFEISPRVLTPGIDRATERVEPAQGPPT